MKSVTLKAIRKHKPCVESWEILLSSLDKTKADDTKVSLEYILDLLGLDDALWALRALPESQDSSVRLLVCDLVTPAMKYTNDPRLAEAIRVAREYALGNATSDSLEAARAAAWSVARAAAEDVPGSATWAMAEDVARKDQERIFRDWLRSES